MISRIAIMLLVLTVSGCISISKEESEDREIKVTTIGIVACGSPSQRITLVQMEGKPDMTLGSVGPDPCNTAIGAAGQVASSALLPGSNLTVSSGALVEVENGVKITQ